MKNNLKKISSLLLGGSVFFTTMISKVIAISNPVIGDSLGGGTDAARNEAAAGTTFVNYFVTIWQAFITIGAIMVIVYFIWGAIQWISAGGNSGKIEEARNKITQSMIGLLILVSSFVIIGFISSLFFGDDFSILNLQFAAPGA